MRHYPRVLFFPRGQVMHHSKRESFSFQLIAHHHSFSEFVNSTAIG
jgi:hypothetical protein